MIFKELLSAMFSYGAPRLSPVATRMAGDGASFSGISEGLSYSANGSLPVRYLLGVRVRKSSPRVVGEAYERVPLTVFDHNLSLPIIVLHYVRMLLYGKKLAFCFAV